MRKVSAAWPLFRAVRVKIIGILTILALLLELP